MMQNLITVNKISTIEAFEAVQSDWNKLLNDSKSDNIFLTFEWMHTWWKVYGNDKELYILVIKSEDEIIGIAPLTLTTSKRFGVKRKTIEFIGTPNADYSDFIGIDKKRVIEKVFTHLLYCKKDWNRIVLTQIPEHSDSLQVLREILNKEKMSHIIKEIEHCSAYVYQGDESERENFKLRRNRTFRNLSHYFERAGGLSLQEYNTPHKIEPYLDTFFNSHIKRWEHTLTPSKFLNAVNREFYRHLVKNLASLDMIRLFVLTLHNQPITYLFTYNFHKVLSLYTVISTSFYLRKSPGIFIFHLTTEDYIRKGYTRIDYARGATPYKGRFTNIHFSNYLLLINKSSLVNSVYIWFDRFKNIALVKSILSTEQVQNFKTKLIDNLAVNGLYGLLRTFIKKIARSFFEYKQLLLLEHKNKVELSQTKENNIEIALLRENNIEELASFLGVVMDSETHKEMQLLFQEKHDCFAVKSNGFIGASAWGFFNKAKLPDIEKELLLDEKQVIITQPKISPVFDNTGIDNFLLKYMTAYYLSKDYQPLVLCLNSARRKIDKLTEYGYVIASKYRSLKILGIKLW